MGMFSPHIYIYIYIYIHILDTLAEKETDTYMLIRSGGQLLDQ